MTMKWDSKREKDAIALKHYNKISLLIGYMHAFCLQQNAETNKYVMFVVKHHNNKWVRCRSIKENQTTPQYRLMTGIFQKWLIQLRQFYFNKFSHMSIRIKLIAKLMDTKSECASVVMRVGGWNFSI